MSISAGPESGPAEDDSPLVVDADAVEPSQVPLERLGPIARRRRQIREHRGVVEHVELPGGDPRDVRPADTLQAAPLPKESLDGRVGEALDRHRRHHTATRYTVSRYAQCPADHAGTRSRVANRVPALPGRICSRRPLSDAEGPCS